MVWIVRLFAFFRFARKQFNVPGLEIWLGSVDIDLFARHLCPLVFFPWPPCWCFDALRFDVLYIIQTPALKIVYKRFSCVKDFVGTWCLVACVNVPLEETLLVLLFLFPFAGCFFVGLCWIVADFCSTCRSTYFCFTVLVFWKIENTSKWIRSSVYRRQLYMYSTR